MEINELAKALSKFQSEMQAVEFDSTNPYFKSKYASLAAIVKQAAPILSKCGLSISQLLADDGVVITVLLHESGQSLESRLKLTPVKNDPQGIGSAITYARRYSYSAILGIVTDDDDDGNSASNTQKQEFPQPKTKTSIEPLKVDSSPILSVPKPIVAEKPIKPSEREVRTITEAEGKALIEIAKKNGYDKTDIKVWAATLGYERLSEMNNMDYEDAVAYFSGKTKEKRLADDETIV